MRVHMRNRLVAAAVLPLLLSVAACSEEAEEKAARGRTLAPCPAGVDTRSPSEQLPSDFPGLSGSRLYRFETLGATRVWFATVEGGSDDVIPVRDRVVAELKDKGYDIRDTDQEAGAEAEAEFGGPHEGTIRTRPLCKDHIEIRYKLDS